MQTPSRELLKALAKNIKYITLTSKTCTLPCTLQVGFFDFIECFFGVFKRQVIINTYQIKKKKG